MKKVLFSFCLLLMATYCHALFRVEYPYFRDLKTLNYETRMKNSGQLLFREKVKIEQAKYEGKDFLVTDSFSQGESLNDGGIDRHTLSYYSIDNKRLTAFAHQVISSGEGIPLHNLQINYDWNKNLADFYSIDHKKRKNIHKMIPLSDSTIFTRDTTILFPALISKRINEKHFKTFIPSGHILSIKALISYIPEEFVISGKKIECYRIELKPAFPLFSLIAPRITFWYLAAPPHYFVRYEGPLGGPFSPTVFQELVL